MCKKSAHIHIKEENIMDMKHVNEVIDKVRSSKLFDAIERFDTIMASSEVSEEIFMKFINEDVTEIMNAVRTIVVETDAIVGKEFPTLSSTIDSLQRLGYVCLNDGKYRSPNGEKFKIAVADNPNYFTVEKL